MRISSLSTTTEPLIWESNSLFRIIWVRSFTWIRKNHKNFMDPLKAFCWKVKCPPKIKHFMAIGIWVYSCQEKSKSARVSRGNRLWQMRSSRGINKPCVFLMSSSASSLGAFKDPIKPDFFSFQFSLHKYGSPLLESSSDGWSSICVDTMVYLKRKKQ